MSNTGKQSPLGVNVMSGLLQGKGFWINQPTANIVGSSTGSIIGVTEGIANGLQYQIIDLGTTTNSEWNDIAGTISVTYIVGSTFTVVDASAAAGTGTVLLTNNYTYGTIISNTVLNNATNAMRQGWVRYNAGDLSLTTYTNLVAMGSSTIPALGNSIPLNYVQSESYNIAYTGENASYGYIRIFPLQAYYEFNYNNTLALSGMYNDFVGTFISAGSFIEYSNQSITAMYNSLTFLDGTYSNMNDLITADVTGISLSTGVFGTDLINLGKALDLSTIWTFGYPSNLLATLKKYNALTPSLAVALLSTGLTSDEINQIANNTNVSKDQQQKVYSAFLVIAGVDLATILVALNCNTDGLVTLADLLNVKKMFPNSYLTLTVPIYNAVPGPTNSKTYYPIYTVTTVTPALTAPAITAVVGPIIPPLPPFNINEVGGRGEGAGNDSGGNDAGGGGIGSGSGYQ